MPKRKTSTSNPSTEQTNGPGETTAGYFRKVFGEHPEWLAGKSNADVLARWLANLVLNFFMLPPYGIASAYRTLNNR
jgi:hypothetical protein